MGPRKRETKFKWDPGTGPGGQSHPTNPPESQKKPQKKKKKKTMKGGGGIPIKIKTGARSTPRKGGKPKPHAKLHRGKEPKKKQHKTPSTNKHPPPKPPPKKANPEKKHTPTQNAPHTKGFTNLTGERKTLLV